MAHRPGRGGGYRSRHLAWAGLRKHLLKGLGFPNMHGFRFGGFILRMCVCLSTVVPDTEKEQEWTPTTGPLLAFKEEDQLLVRRLSRHILHGEGN